MTTKYTEEAQKGDRGVAFVHQVATEAGFIFRPFETADVGIDGAIELLDEARGPTGDIILVQIKSGAAFVRKNFSVLPGDKAHFETWARYGVPVVGIIHDPASSEARWVDISEHIRRHPEQTETGPYTLRAPSAQPFSVASFPAFARRFSRVRQPSTRIDVTPNLLIRSWNSRDSGPVRALLAPIAADYPGFQSWLGKSWMSDASKKVVEVGSAVAAYSMWSRKDERNIKLQTFFVGSSFRGTAIGQHLLYHELRTWADIPQIERVHVTVASDKSELIEYFRRFGFRIEGISANRYHRTSSNTELVLAKHFLRQTVRSIDDLDTVADVLASRIWGIDRHTPTNTRFGVSADDLSVPGALPSVQMNVTRTTHTASPRIVLIDDAGKTVRSHDDASIMRDFYPLRLHLLNKRYVIVPIFREWVTGMFATAGPVNRDSMGLKLRVDNAYYCYPKILDLSAGDLVLFYETKKRGGCGGLIGSAIVREVVIDAPQRLHQRFGDRGVYTLADIQRHVKDGVAMAIHFELFEQFSRPVQLSRVRQILNNRTNLQGLNPIGRDDFEHLRCEGLEAS